MDSSAPFNILSLCSGVAGLEVGLHEALRESGFLPRTVCYVEGEAYAASVLAARMGAGDLDQAPVWSDVRTFDATAWRGRVDLVTAGYPCQPFSLAGKRGGSGDPRHLWPEVLRVLVECGSPTIFIENVRGHASKGLGEVLGQLACFGFDAEWDVFSAEEEGAPHRRERIFILANRVGFQLRQQQRRRGGESGQGPPEPRVAGPDRSATELRDMWRTEPPVVRGADGSACRVDRNRAVGNAVYPASARRAFLELSERIKT